MNFTYDLESVGWAKVTLEMNGKEMFFNPSYLTEPLVDLLSSLMTLLPEFTPVDEVVKSSTFEWDQEPAIVEWKLEKLNAKQIRIIINQYKDGIKELNGNELREQLLSEVCDIREFISHIVSSLDMVISKYGLIGYRENWYRGDFPIGRYLKLKHYCLHESPISIDVINEKEWNEYRKTSLDYELEMLKSLIKEAKLE